jgi:hypothetical protein
MTRLIYAQSKLSKETQNFNKTGKAQRMKLSAGKATACEASLPQNKDKLPALSLTRKRDSLSLENSLRQMMIFILILEICLHLKLFKSLLKLYK